MTFPTTPSALWMVCARGDKGSNFRVDRGWSVLRAGLSVVGVSVPECQTTFFMLE